MIVIPQFEKLVILGYGLYPGEDKSHEVEIDFRSGLTVVAGINGLGKTTLLTLLLRMISGPFDLTSSGPPEKFEAVLPDDPKKLNRNVIDFFAQRVADGARDSFAGLEMLFGDKRVNVQRRMSDLKLSAAIEVDGNELVVDEAQYQVEMARLFNVSSFVHVLLLLHSLIFFNERKAGALWDGNAQRHVLGAIVLNNKLSAKFGTASRTLQSADSQFRNTRAQASKFRDELNEMAVSEGESPEVRARLKATAEAIAGSAEKLESLELELSDQMERHKIKRLEFEKAKLENESALGLIERAKYTSLLHSFPKMDDAARLLLARLLSEGECLVCGAEAKEKKAELEALLLKGLCPSCGAPPDKQLNSSDPSKFEQVKMKSARKKADVAARELRKAEESFKRADIEKKAALEAVVAARHQLSVLQDAQTELSALLPPDSERVERLKDVVNEFEERLAKERGTLAIATEEYQKILSEVSSKIVKIAETLSAEFSDRVNELLSERAALVTKRGTAKIGQESTSKFEFPVFVAEMTAADKPGLTVRQSQDDVSESQRELIDLAFRLALIEVASEGDAATFVMETPEASLDGIAMKKVGSLLRDFATQAGNRLIISNNLTNAGMITAIFGGATKSVAEKARREASVFNLLVEAAPNQALLDNRPEYEALLKEAVFGVNRAS